MDLVKNRILTILWTIKKAIIYEYPYGYPYMGSQGSLGWDTLGWDTLGGPMGPWDRWDLGTDGTWASRTPDTSSEDTSSELFIDTRQIFFIKNEVYM